LGTLRFVAQNACDALVFIPKHNNALRMRMHALTLSSGKPRGLLLGVLLAVASVTAGVAQQSDCADVEPRQNGWGFFGRRTSCRDVVQNGSCERYTGDGFCLLSCGACPAAEVAGEEAPPEDAPPEELDDESAAAAAYREKLMEEVAIMEDGQTEVEQLPTLTYEGDLPAVGGGSIDDGVDSADSVGSDEEGVDVGEDGVAFAAVEGDGAVATCDRGSALDALASADSPLETLIQIAEALNVASVLGDPSIEFTLFAPVDSAWDDVFPDLETQLEDVDGTRDVLFTHIVADSLLESLQNGSIEPLSGATLFVRDGDRVISRAATGNVIDTLVGCNWIVHIIDGVLGEQADQVNPDFAQILRG
jgi:uncharacterized surface protein with fasciclin (FAS1) repeats